MKKLFLPLLLSFISCLPAKGKLLSSPPRKRPIEVRMNANVELLGFAYFVGYEGQELENEADEQRRNRKIKQYSYGYQLYRQYRSFQESQNLKVIIGFAQDIWLDYFIALLVQLDDCPHADLKDQIGESYYIRFSPTRNPAEARRNASLFIEAMNKLYREVAFDQYLEQSRPLYENALGQVKDRLPADTFIPEMERYYGKHFEWYTLLPSLTLPAGMGFGVSHPSEGKTRVYNVFGAFGEQSFREGAPLDMGFADLHRLREKSTHEFGHSFVNPVIDQLPPTLLAETEALFEPIRNDMSRQAYTHWKTCLYEHFVRAGEVLIARRLGFRKEAEQLQRDYVRNRKFIYLPLILKELERINRRRSPSYGEAVESAMQKLKRKVG